MKTQWLTYSTLILALPSVCKSTSYIRKKKVNSYISVTLLQPEDSIENEIINLAQQQNIDKRSKNSTVSTTTSSSYTATNDNKLRIQIYPNEPPMVFENVPLPTGSSTSLFASGQQQQETVKTFWHGEGNQSTVNIVFVPNDDVTDSRQVTAFGSIVDEAKDLVHRIGRDAQGHFFMETIPIDLYPQDSYPYPIAVTANNNIIPDIKDGERERPEQKEDEIRIQPEETEEAHETKQIIDILVIWTKNAECMNSNVPIAGCTPTSITHANMFGLTKLAITETNVAFALSGIHVELHLVGAYRHPTYTESSADKALTDITSVGSDLNDAHEYRQAFGADLVAFLIHDSTTCGLSWIGPYKEYMFSVISWNCATGYFSFAHEIGHNFGCNHDRGSENKCSNEKEYNYGYRDPNSKFRSIMSYNCARYQCDDIDGSSCPRVQRFSNRQYLYKNNTIGTEWNDCARHINNVASIVSKYY